MGSLNEGGQSRAVRRLSYGSSHLSQGLGSPVQVQLNVGCKQFGQTDVAQLSVVGIAQVDEPKRLVLLKICAAVTHVALSDPKIKVAHEVMEIDHGIVTFAIGITRLRHASN